MKDINDMNDLFEYLKISFATFLPNLIKSVIILLAGYFAIKLVRYFMKKLILSKGHHDPTLLKFLMDMLTWVLRILLFIIVVSNLGVETSAFVAVVGAAGLAIGLSLQGSLSNFAGGILIILFKPFKVGDFIETQGEGGTVAEIQILYTRLLTPNNQVVYIPNGALSNNNIKNYSKEAIRKAEIIIGAAYSSDIMQVKQVLSRIIENDSRILKEPSPVIRIKELADNSVNYQVFAWATNEDYWQMLSDFKENAKIEFDKEGIEIPFPQRDVYIRKFTSGESTEQ